MTNDIIGKTAFGIDFGLLRNPSNKKTNETSVNEDDEVSHFLEQHIRCTNSLKMGLNGSFSIILGIVVPILQEPFRQLLRRIPGTVDHRINVANSTLRDKMDGIVAKRESESSNRRGSKDFLSVLLNVREAKGGALKDLITPDYVSGITYEHLIAGSMTTSFTLTATIYLVAKHRTVEEKLLEEIDGFGWHDAVPSPIDLVERFPYLDQLGIQEIKLSLIHLYRRFVFRCSPELEEPPELEHGMVHEFKHGIKLRVIKRAFT
ncbi:Cytochrome P450 [Acorus gramineus]|uniref:Cytochrome P450 n=1 Tax=Acorus gramineus TaxID=55184 RepID=A0AAV9AMS0_ACOGR|nr:Cytochrome P450 [Acorus gramineus]